jgi:hypothetical protein
MSVSTICSLLISVVALAVSVVVAIRTARLATAQSRTELLTKLYCVQVEYARFNRRVGELKQNPPSDPLPPELTALLDAETAFKKLEQVAARYRQALFGPKSELDTETLLILGHHTNAIAMRIEDDNKRLDEILARINAVTRRQR